jgi:hypothetical protein
MDDYLVSDCLRCAFDSLTHAWRFLFTNPRRNADKDLPPHATAPAPAIGNPKSNPVFCRRPTISAAGRAAAKTKKKGPVGATARSKATTLEAPSAEGVLLLKSLGFDF